MLEGLVSGAAEDARAREQRVPIGELERRAAEQKPVSPLIHSLAEGSGVGIIAEIKRASPSRGKLAEIADPVALAREYESGGARAISVLTESRQFLGSLDDLEAVAHNVAIPVLRKDFITSRYQVVESRAHGADLVLLIMACLDDDAAGALLSEIRRWGMEALVETHSEEELTRAVGLGAAIIGVNARDLATFELDRALFSRLSSRIPAGVVKVAESAVSGPEDVIAYKRAGADCVLVGEALVTDGNPQQTVREFGAL